MPANLYIIVPWIIVAILIIIVIFISLSSPKDEDSMVYMNPMDNINDSCNSGGIIDDGKKYLNATNCFKYVGQKVSDVKKDASTHSKDLKWQDMPNNSKCHKRSANDIVGGASVYIDPKGINPSSCWLYSDSDVQLVYSPTANPDGGILEHGTAIPGSGAAYNKKYVAVNY